MSERKNNMKNTMTINEIRRHFELRRKREAVRANLKRIGEAAAAVAAKADTFTLNGNTYTVNNDPAHQRDQLAGYCGNNPK